MVRISVTNYLTLTTFVPDRAKKINTISMCINLFMEISAWRRDYLSPSKDRNTMQWKMQKEIVLVENGEFIVHEEA